MLHRPILIMAGGTGGHVYPALAVADYLKRHGVPFLWLGTNHGLEAQLVPAKGFPLLTIKINGLRGKGMIKWMQAPVILCIALIQALMIFIQRKPAAVLGMGGFASGPGGIAAWLMRIPLCIHEQNAVAGLTNRLLAPLADTVMEAYPKTFPAKFKAQTTGNPVRTEILNVNAPDKRMRIENAEVMKLLVLGGSQGARTLNKIVPYAVALLPRNIKLEIIHQTGQSHYAETVALYKTLNCVARIEPYIDDMAEAYAWADIVICRAGALTIAELSAAGVASILVPFPYAVDDHQTANARYLSDQGGALLLPESEFTSENLEQLLNELYHSRSRLLAMAQEARALAKPAATEQVAELCLKVAYA